MWRSRKPATRLIDGVSLQTAKRAVQDEGFEQREADDGAAHLRKPGKWLAMSAGSAPLDLTIATGEHEQLEVHLRYGMFVLFDTGDLDKEVDRLVEVIRVAA